MKVSARAGFAFLFFLNILVPTASVFGQVPMYPPLAPPTDPNTPSPKPKSVYPGAAPGLTAQLPGQPKDLSGRFGLGVTNLGPNVLPALSVDWQTSRSTSVEFDLAFDSLKDDSDLLLFGRFSRNMFIEESLHFFLYMGGGVSSGQSNGKSQSGLLLEAGAGVRVFFAGLPNLGWHLRYGLFFKGAGNDRMFTTGISGVHYYF